MRHELPAVLGLAACIALAVHMALPRRAQARVESLLRSAWAWLQAQWSRLTGWRRQQRQARAAAQEAQRVIRRAREAALHDTRDSRIDGEWTDNVYRPKRFEKPKKPH